MTLPSLPDVLADLGASSPSAPVRFGRYDVIGSLGRGGMGTVYQAIDRERGTRVALKTLTTADATASMWLKREFRVVADVAHENLAAVYELGSERGVSFFTMELVVGTSLSRWARQDPDAETELAPLPLSRTLPSFSTETAAVDAARPAPGAEAPTRRVADWRPSSDDSSRDPHEGVGRASPPTRDLADVRRAFASLVRGVAALHQAGLRHGDIKPGNVLVESEGRVVLVDFGLVRPVNERREDATPSCGTPAFMAPEQFGKGAVGPEADWYAVGATLYRVLTGWHPFTAGSLVDLYVKKMHQLPPRAHSVVEGVPLDLSDLCVLLMSPEPAVRPSKEVILRVLEGASTAAELASPRARRRRFVGRETELFALERAYGAARAGVPILVHAHGPSGIGKSALLESFLAAVQDVDAALVLRGRCFERESVPYKGFDRIVDDLAERLRTRPDAEVRALLPAWAGELGRAFPALASVPAIAERASSKQVAHDAMELRRRAWAALAELLAALRETGSVVLAIDDLQWIDEDSAHLLESLLERPTEERSPTRTGERAPPSSLLIVVLSRPVDEADNPALVGHAGLRERLTAQGRFVDLPLTGLSDEEALELARAALEDAGSEEGEERARSLVREAGGVPFFIEELAHYTRAPVEAASMGTVAARPEGGDVSLDEVIRARVRALPADQRALAEVVAVAASPLPQSVVLEAAGLEQGSLPALLALRRASLVSGLGVGADDTVSTYHDRIRESIVSSLDEKARKERHLAVGRALAKHRGGSRSWVFEAIGHLRAASELIDDPAERLEVVRLHAQAGDRARDAAAFPLAFECFEAGIALLPEGAWDLDYAIALRLHQGATDAAYLTANWAVLDQRIAAVKQNARSIMDEVVAWQAQIDGHVGRHQYIAALDTALVVLSLLGVDLPRDPTEAEVGQAVMETLERLTMIGPDRLLDQPGISDPVVAAATEIQVRVSPAAYFGKPMLLPIIACNLVRSSIDRGVSPATPYALALFGIVLNTIDLQPVAHEWGQLALKLLERWPSRRLEAATKHILFNLVCCWMVPLRSVLGPLREVFDIGCETGDYEYASYAAHGYVHNAIYVGRPLGPLREEALRLGKSMRALGQVNAVHVHAPFERLLEALTGRLERPWSLDGDGFDEQALLDAGAAEGSRSGIFVLSVAMGLARSFFGRPAEASACFERARGYLDAAPSVWHVPILHQYAALSACAASDDEPDPERRAAHRANAESSLSALRKLAVLAPVNFAHRVSMIEAELLRLDGDAPGALAKLDVAIREAQAGAWVNDVALANELATRSEPDLDGKRRRRRAARLAYSAWGATAKADALEASA